MTISGSWTSGGSEKYTLVWLDGADGFTVDGITDESGSQAQSNDLSGEYDLPGLGTANTTKKVDIVVSSNKPGTTKST